RVRCSFPPRRSSDLIDRGGGLALSDGRARDRDDRERGRFMEPFDQLAKRPILLGFKRGWLDQAHEMLVESVGGGSRTLGGWPQRLVRNRFRDGRTLFTPWRRG